MSLDDVGESLSWREAVGLARALVSDPSSRLAAAVHGWPAPLDQTWYLGRLLSRVAGFLGPPVDWPEVAEQPHDPREVAEAEALLARYTAIPSAWETYPG